MKRKTLLTLFAPLTLSVLLSACDRAPDAHPQPAPKSWNLPLMQAPAGAPAEYTSVGSVVSDQRVDVTSRLSGDIHEIGVQEGDRVRRGQVIARLDAADVEGGIRQAQAGVGAAQRRSAMRADRSRALPAPVRARQLAARARNADT